jgi:hypothetical protein
VIAASGRSVGTPAWATARHIFHLLDTDEIAVRQDLPDLAGYLAGTGEILAIRWETINLADKLAYVEGNAVRVKGAWPAVRASHRRT